MTPNIIEAPDFENNEALVAAAYADSLAWVKSDVQPESYVVAGRVAEMSAPIVAGLMEAESE